MKQRVKNVLVPSLLTGFLVAAFAVCANAATFVVNTTADTLDATAGNGICADSGGFCSLRAAITEANALAGADIITLPAGTYTIGIAESQENANANGDFDITSDITINGAGAGSTIVEANAAPGVAVGRVFHVRFTAPSTVAVFNDITVRHGRYATNTFGAGIRVDVGAATLTLNRCVVRDNLNASSGGGVSVSAAANAVLNIIDSTITANGAGSSTAGTSASGAGVHINSATTVTITNSTISNNASNNAIASSTAAVFGGGIFITAGTTTITGSTISGNSASVTGAGATGLAFAGGIYNQQSTLNLTNSTVTGNTSTGVHAGIRTLAGTIPAVTNITNSTISGNTANGTEGGGVVNFATSSAVATTNINGSTISGNRVLGVGGFGGGLQNFASAAIAGQAVMNVTNSTISGNSSPQGGGGVNGGAAATTTYLFATIASNTATTIGGGLLQTTDGTTNLRSSIVADNTAPTGPDISGTIASQDYNHVEDTSGGVFFVDSGKSGLVNINFLPLPNDVTGVDPQLGPLAANGGTTLTHIPGPASPATNAIPLFTNDCGTTVTTSQNLAARPSQTGCEKGAAERAVTSAAATLSGRVSTARGQGLANALITVSGGNLAQPVVARTSTFGLYRIEGLVAGEVYTVQVSSKRFTFEVPARVVSLGGDVADIDFIANSF